MATAALKRLIDGQALTCKGDTRDRYRRLIAVCFVGRIDLNEQMVLRGWALAYRRYSMAYVRAEQAAKAAGVGMWRGRFVAPWEWRKRKRAR
ncbi:MAG: thermonuclease family protein [Alphaproteobacteria bacterium]